MGTYTTNKLLYKPAQGATGPTEMGKLDGGFDRVDTLLGEGVVNVKGFYDGANWDSVTGDGETDDSSKITAIVALTGSKKVIIPSGVNILVADELVFPATMHVIMEHGAKFTVSSDYLSFSGGLTCQGDGPHFDIAAGANIFVNGPFYNQSHSNIFTGSGNVYFGRSHVNLVTDGDFVTNPAGTWTLGTGWAWNEASHCVDKTGANTNTLSFSPTISAGKVYVVRWQLTNVSATISSASGISVTLGGTVGQRYNNEGTFEDILVATDTTGLIFTPAGTDFAGSIDNVEVREYLNPRITQSGPYWFNWGSDVTADCSDAFQKAIDTVYSCGGGEVALGAGLFPIGKRVNLRRNVHVKGQGTKTLIRTLPTFTLTKDTGYAAFGVSNEAGDARVHTLLSDAYINLTKTVQDEVVCFWLNKQLQAGRLANLKMRGNYSKAQQGIVAPKDNYDDGGNVIGHANNNGWVLENIFFDDFNHASGALYGEVNSTNDLQDWKIKKCLFAGTNSCKTHVVWGGINCTFRDNYFDPVSSSPMLYGGATAGLYPRIKLTGDYTQPNYFVDNYWEAGTDVYIWSPVLSYPQSSSWGAKIRGLFTASRFIATAPALDFTRTSDTTLEYTGSLYTSYVMAAGHTYNIWITLNDGTGYKKYTATYSWSSPTATLTLTTGTLPGVNTDVFSCYIAGPGTYMVPEDLVVQRYTYNITAAILDALTDTTGLIEDGGHYVVAKAVDGVPGTAYVYIPLPFATSATGAYLGASPPSQMVMTNRLVNVRRNDNADSTEAHRVQLRFYNFSTDTFWTPTGNWNIFSAT